MPPGSMGPSITTVENDFPVPQRTGNSCDVRMKISIKYPSKSDGSEFSEGWETDTEDEEQDEGLITTPAEKQYLPVSIGPDDATATAQAAKRALFVKGK